MKKITVKEKREQEEKRLTIKILLGFVVVGLLLVFFGEALNPFDGK